MKTRRCVKLFAVCLMAIILLAGLVGACAEPEPTTAPTEPSPSAPPTAPSAPPTEPSAPPTAPSAPPTEPSAPPTAPTETKWWEEKWGVPKYGGKVNIIVGMLGDQFDPWFTYSANYQPYDHLFQWDWHIDRDVWAYKGEGAPADYYTGLLAESWEWEDPVTLVIHLRQGVKWHNRPPTNGRELTADDVVWHYDRVLGTGSGFTESNPFTSLSLAPVINVTKRDKYTVVVNFKEATPLANWWAITDAHTCNSVEPPELLTVDVTDYNSCAGTGAFMVTDYVAGNSLTLSRNPDYYLYDTAYPENQLPYLDEVKLTLIIDQSTQIAALRSGQGDQLGGVQWQTVENLKKTNPEIVFTMSPSMGYTFDYRVDKEPFTDIRVRKALQLAINIPEIAESLYGGYPSGNPPNMLIDDYKGWTRPYEEWPEDIKQAYVYDPDQARQLLTEAGYPDGFETNIYIQSTDDSDLVQVVKSYFAEIGVDMEINVMDRMQFNPFVQAGKHDQMRLNFFSNMFFSIPIPYLCRLSTEPMNNIYAPAEETAVYDDLYQQLLAAPDETAAAQIGFQMQDYFYRQHWTALTPGLVGFSAHQSRLKGYDGECIGQFTGPWFWKHWWIDEGQ